MTTIKITREVGGHHIGDTINVTAGAATYLVDNGYAEAETTDRKNPKGTGRTTRKAEVGGVSPAELAQTDG